MQDIPEGEGLASSEQPNCLRPYQHLLDPIPGPPKTPEKAPRPARTRRYPEPDPYKKPRYKSKPADRPGPGADAFLCTQCWVTGNCEHYPDPDWRGKPESDWRWELCELCARGFKWVASRWSWLACTDCVKINISVQKAYGSCLPLGRHSIMNMVAVRFSEKDPAVLNAEQAALLAQFRGWNRLATWGNLQRIRLCETLIPAELLAQPCIKASVWQEHAQQSLEASRQAWLDYAGLRDFAELHDVMQAKYAAGEVRRPDSVPDRNWIP